MHQAARRYWRQVHFARTTLGMLEMLRPLTDQIAVESRDQFDRGQLPLGGLIQAFQNNFQVQVRYQQRLYDLRSAEAWLLAAQGKVKPDVLLHPGWQ